jgi:hypothetical protein
MAGGDKEGSGLDPQMNADERRYVYTEKKKKIKLAAPVPFAGATGQAQINAD